MDCVDCGRREASVFIRRGGGADLALCESCARSRGISAGQGQLSIRIEDLVAPPGDGDLAALSCPACGSTLEGLRGRGRIGCATCAESFRGEIGSLLRQHGRPPWFRDQPRGQAPGERPVPAPVINPGQLRAALDQALAAEDYELAARLRDGLDGSSAREGSWGPHAPPDPTAPGSSEAGYPFSCPVFGYLPAGPAEGDDVILQSQARLVRNYADLPFPGSPKGGLVPSRARAPAAIALLPGLRSWRLADLPPNFGRSLVERGFVARAWSADPESLLAASAIGSLALLADESDHIVLLSRLPGLAVRSALGQVSLAGQELEALGNLAFDQEFGWLASRLDSLGTGLGISLQLHLPALSFLGMVDRVLGPLLEAGLAIRGMAGAEEGSVGDIFEVMTEHAYGATAERMASVAEAAAGAAAAERRARSEIATWKSEELLDRAGRAIGLLRHARRLDQGEAASALSSLRLASLAGRLRGLDAREAGRYLGLLGPASLALDARRRGLEMPPGPDAGARAGRLRSLLLSALVEHAELVEGGESCSRD